MEIILNILRDLQLDMIQVFATGMVLFTIGYRIGIQKSRKLNKKIHELEKDVLDLNAELLNN